MSRYSRRALHVALGLGLAFVAVAPVADAAYWARWTDVGQVSMCLSYAEGVMGVGCNYGFCGSSTVKCMGLPNGIVVDSSTEYWSPAFSEEDDGNHPVLSTGWYRVQGSNYKICEPGWPGGIMMGISCSGASCDNVSIRCGVPRRPDGSVVVPTNCQWTSQFSEEQGDPDFQMLYGVNYFVTGMKCFGSYCDNHSYYICKIE